MIVPTLRVGMQPVTLRVAIDGVSCWSGTHRGAWERWKAGDRRSPAYGNLLRKCEEL